jgi:hypothetical protein
MRFEQRAESATCNELRAECAARDELNELRAGCGFRVLGLEKKFSRSEQWHSALGSCVKHDARNATAHHLIKSNFINLNLIFQHIRIGIFAETHQIAFSFMKSLPFESCKPMEITPETIEQIPEIPGVYAIFEILPSTPESTRCRFINTADNCRQQIKSHFQADEANINLRYFMLSQKRKLVHACFLPDVNNQGLEDLKEIWIELFEPDCNFKIHSQPAIHEMKHESDLQVA